MNNDHARQNRNTKAQVSPDGRVSGTHRLGSTDELAAEIERLNKVAADPFAYLLLQYTLVMSNGKGKLDPLDNHRYPGVKPTSAEEFFHRVMS